MRSLPLVLLLVAVCGAYVSAAKLEQTSLIRQKRDDVVSSQLNNLIQRVTDVVNYVIGEIQRFLRSLGFGTIIGLPKNDTEKRSIRSANRNHQNHLIVGHAAAKNCLADFRANMSKIISEIAKKYVSCVVNHAPEDEVINKLRDIIKKVVEFVKKLNKGIKKCSKEKGLKIKVCLGKLYLSLEKSGIALFKEITRFIIKDGGEILRLLTFLPKNLARCAGPALSDFVAKSVKAGSEAINCIVNDVRSTLHPDGCSCTVIENPVLLQ